MAPELLAGGVAGLPLVKDHVCVGKERSTSTFAY